MLINSGVNPLVVRDLVGHTTVDMTARYTHVAMDTKIKAVEALPVFSGEKSQIQSSPLAAVITSLPAAKLSALAAYLEEVLTRKQKEGLLLRLGQNENNAR